MTYLDHAAATDIYPEVKDLVGELLAQDLGNPSSVHSRGKEARFLIDKAHQSVATVFGVQAKDIVFTSGATEALNLAVVGSYLAIPEDKRKKKILVSPIAHSCVLGAVDFLVQHFGVERIEIPLVKETGHFDIENMSLELLCSVDGVVVEHGNSEIGILQNIEALGKMVQSIESNPFLIIDTAASVVSCPMVLELKKQEWKPDVIVLSGEKFGGLSGTGVLVRFTESHIKPLVSGSHEFGMRGGTENLLGICAFAKALELHVKNMFVINETVSEASVYADHILSEKNPSLVRVGGRMFVGHILVYLLPEGMKSDLFVTQCDMKGIQISSGSACSSGTISGNKALLALGYTEEEAKRSIRISFGRTSTKDDVDSFVKKIGELL